MTTHACPINGCPVVGIPHERLMCNKHWRYVPGKVQREVWKAYHRRESSSEAAHAHALVISKAIALVNATVAEKEARRAKAH